MVSTPVTVIPAKMQWGRYNLFKWFARFITWVIEILLQLGDTKPSKLQAAGTQFPAGLTPAALSTLYSVPYLWSVDARISTELAKAGASPVIHLWSNSVPLFCLATQLSIFREARWNVAPQQLYCALIFPKDPLLYSTWSKHGMLSNPTLSRSCLPQLLPPVKSVMARTFAMHCALQHHHWRGSILHVICSCTISAIVERNILLYTT